MKRLLPLAIVPILTALAHPGCSSDAPSANSSPLDGAVDDARADGGSVDASEAGVGAHLDSSDGESARDAGLDAAVEVGSPSLPGETCETAQVLSPVPNGPSLVVAGESTFGYRHDYGDAIDGRCIFAPAPDHVYSVEVPNGMTLDVVVRPGAGFDVALNIAIGLESCNPISFACTVGVDDVESQAEAGGYTNRSGVTKTAFIIVDSAANTPGAYKIDVSLRSETPGETCHSAIEMPVGNSTGSLAGFSNDYGDTAFKDQEWATCPDAANAERVYWTELSPGAALHTTLLSVPSDLNLGMVVGSAAQCDLPRRVCVARGDLGLANEVDTACYQNKSQLVENVFLIIDGTESNTRGTYTLTTAINQDPCPVEP
jgi:hypothetical protein